ncbi:winged helix-turn-helix domain-containing protein [Oceanicaulis sp.]|uniref:winged helix-turn-helix domain-containing protein n=1 Tax=Oceanicaulis sp. TaxID=1924941 RepID=UPI003BACFF21
MNETSDTDLTSSDPNSGVLLAGDGRLRLDPVRMEVELEGERLELGGRSFTLLHTLMRHPMQLLSKDKLIELVWEGRAVSDAVLTTAVRDLRLALDDNAKRPLWIKTEHGRGYRFISDVLTDVPQDVGSTLPRTSSAHLRAPNPDAASAETDPPVYDRPHWRFQTAVLPVLGLIGLGLVILVSTMLLVSEREPTALAANRSVAVLEFENLSAEDDTAWFADALSEELTGALTRVSDLRVASRRATISATQDSEDLQDIAHHLGVANILEGTVRIAGDQVRVTVSLVSADDGARVWSQSYDRDFNHLLSLQSDIATAVANTLDTALDPDTLVRMASVGTESIAAYEAYMRGKALMAEFWQTGRSESWARAQPLLDRARSIDPDFAQAHAASALVFKYSNTPSLVMREDALSGEAYRQEYAARMDAAIAAARDPIEAASYRASRDLELFELDAAREALDTYLTERPYDIDANFQHSNTLVMLGRHEEAQQVIRRLAQIIPVEDAQNRSLLIQHARKSRDFEFAATLARETLANHPFFGVALVEAHWAFLYVDAVDEAREVAARLETSQVGRIAQMGIRLNQLCADGNREDALPIAAEMTNHPRSFIIAWHAYRALGDDDAAYDRLLELDAPGSPPARLRTLLLNDPSFDPARFEHLSAALVEAGGRLTQPSPPAVRCPPA